MKMGFIKLLLLSFTFAFGQKVFANNLSLKYAENVSPEHKKILVPVMEEVSFLLPPKLKEKLPANIEIKVANIGRGLTIPSDVCTKVNREDAQKVKKPFVYGSYNYEKNLLLINEPVLYELKKGKLDSTKINCQHKSLYDQAIATLVHELTHAYDFHNGRISNSMEYIRRAGFKKGLLRIKSKNIQAMRSADPYELVNIAESFAVNMEYFTMDPEFMCRKPSMFEFFKKEFQIDPFPNRNCTPNSTVMMSTQVGYMPVRLDMSRVFRIDYLLASAGKELMSGFGHSMFRIVMCAPEHVDPISKQIIPATPFGKKCLEDKFYHLVISYRANVQDATLNYMKGIFGGYPSVLYILNFGDVLDEYNRDELRDIVSYPLNLSKKERDDFVTRVKEEHWNYRGSYKFINNNCATESYDLLKTALQRDELDKKSSLSPSGVLEDLDKMQFLSMTDKEVETYKAQTDQIVTAHKEAYGYMLKNEKADKDAAIKFVTSSTVEQRLKKFSEFKKTVLPSSELNEELNLLKKRLVKSSSFSVMEQQILRTIALKMKKQIGDLLMKNEDKDVQDLLAVARRTFGKSVNELSQNGYGIPLENEMISSEELESNQKDSKEVMDEVEKLLKGTFPKEFGQIAQVEKNIKTYSSYSLEVRKEYRTKLDLYVKQVLKNLSHEEFTRSILVEAANGDKVSLKKVRDLMGKDLVTENEILDSKLKKIIIEII
ncbi:MAG: DUF4105 domain-containing protein [Bdellovibrionales bacterium]|nr:DUF4105 domain-containing protein [Bdellovibrionales bacterium]